MRIGPIFTCLFAIVTAILSKIYIDTHIFKVKEVEFTTDKIPQDSAFTILQLSDLHNKVFGKNNDKLVETVERLTPDIIVITGDLIDRETKDFRDVFNLVENLQRLNEDIYFVTGNHEWENTWTEKFLTGLRKRHIHVLDNKNKAMTLGEYKINLVGLDDPSKRHEQFDQAFTGYDADNYTVLLSHAPDIIWRYQSIPANLILSGHTHGGQIRFPFVGAVVAPSQKMFPSYDKGIFKFEKDHHLYIDSGLGTSRIAVRFLNQSQMTFITIKNDH